MTTNRELPDDRNPFEGMEAESDYVTSCSELRAVLDELAHAEGTMARREDLAVPLARAASAVSRLAAAERASSRDYTEIADCLSEVQRLCEAGAVDGGWVQPLSRARLLLETLEELDPGTV